MADYQSLISRAVAGLEHNTGENRRMLYERARAALVTQLRSVDPPLDEAAVIRERVALEEAIRKVEAEAATKTSPGGGARTAEPAPTLRDQGLRDFRETVAEAARAGDGTAGANSAVREKPRAVAGERAAAGDRPVAAPPSEPPRPHEDGWASYAGAGARSPLRPAPVDRPAEPEERPPRPVRSTAPLVKWAAVAAVVVALAALGYWQRQTVGALVGGFRTASDSASRPSAPPPATQPKIDERIESKTASPATAPAAAVAQKVVLYDEDPSNPQGRRYVGSAIWRTETVSPGPGLAPELAIRADVEIPERHMRMTLSIRRNTDKALPASHTIEVMFTLPADFDQGGIGNVPGLLMKTNEQARGLPLAGLSVKVTNGYFLIGLSAVELDVQRNLELLKSRDWFDIPIIYSSGKRAILALEKGTPGQRVFEEAFRAWGE
ncbi:MAG: hypothetical protein IRY89_05680 [Pseudolabrys sp.]|nr:hypothetical protein [Pseudolabrys sp.]